VSECVHSELSQLGAAAAVATAAKPLPCLILVDR